MQLKWVKHKRKVSSKIVSHTNGNRCVQVYQREGHLVLARCIYFMLCLVNCHVFQDYINLLEFLLSFGICLPTMNCMNGSQLQLQQYYLTDCLSHSFKLLLHTLSHTHNYLMALWTLFGITQVSHYQNQYGFYWSKRQWVVVASAGLHAKLHPPQTDNQHPTTQFSTGRMPFLPPNQQCQSTESTKDNIWQTLLK